MDNNIVLKLDHVTRCYDQGSNEIEIFKNLNFSLKIGEKAAIIGPSGCGKSSLLHIAGLLEAPSKGNIYIGGYDCAKLSDNKRTLIRRNEIGFVYQFHHLLPEFTAIENVMIPQMITGVGKKEAKSRSEELLNLIGLAERLQHRPPQLSGGEKQRVAIARALANKPKLLLADEPTGNLDPLTSEIVYENFLNITSYDELSVLVVTHDQNLAHKMDSIYTLKNGDISKKTSF